MEFDENEIFLQSISYKNTFFLITIIKYSSVINVYKINKFKIEKNIIDLSDKQFLGKKKVLKLYYAMLKDMIINLEKIEGHSPNAIEKVSEVSKLYLTNDGILISLDKSKSYTQIIYINLNDCKATIKNLKKPYLFDQQNLKTNSFILKNNIYHFSSNSKEMVFSIKNINTNGIYKEYRITKDDTINFKNSPIIQEGGMYDNYRELDETKKFLRKISQGQIGISIHQQDDNYQITLGGFKIIKGGGMPMPGFGGIPIANVGAATVFINPTMLAYNSYAGSRSTYFNCLFDKDFNHSNAEIKENIFDKISKFNDKYEQVINAETIFRYKDFLIMGTATKQPNVEYRLLKFTN